MRKTTIVCDVCLGEYASTIQFQSVDIKVTDLNVGLDNSDLSVKDVCPCCFDCFKTAIKLWQDKVNVPKVITAATWLHSPNTEFDGVSALKKLLPEKQEIPF
jgi:hypothetical protein